MHMKFMFLHVLIAMSLLKKFKIGTTWIFTFLADNTFCSQPLWKCQPNMIVLLHDNVSILHRIYYIPISFLNIHIIFLIFSYFGNLCWILSFAVKGFIATQLIYHDVSSCILIRYSFCLACQTTWFTKAINLGSPLEKNYNVF